MSSASFYQWIVLVFVAYDSWDIFSLVESCEVVDYVMMQLQMEGSSAYGAGVMMWWLLPLFSGNILMPSLSFYLLEGW